MAWMTRALRRSERCCAVLSAGADCSAARVVRWPRKKGALLRCDPMLSDRCVISADFGLFWPATRNQGAIAAVLVR